MFSNVGKKIQKVAEYSFVTFSAILLLFVLVFAIRAISSDVDVSGGVVFGLAVVLLVLWLPFAVLFGFGKIIECVEQMAQRTVINHSGTHEKVDKLETLVRIREEGLITEKEYQMAKSRFSTPEEMLRTVKAKYDAGEITEQQYADAKIKILSRL